jgi:hypothetical protein
MTQPRSALLLVLSCTVLAACGLRPERLFSSYTDIEVREVARSLYCNTPGEDPVVQLLPDAQAVLDWQKARGVALAGSESVVQAPYAIVEMGGKPTGGYGLAVARSAVLRGELLILQATFVSPAQGSLRTQAASSPCVLVQLPRGRYRTVDVQDQAGTVRAHGGLPQAAPEAGPATAEPATTPMTPPETAAPEPDAAAPDPAATPPPVK